MRRIGVGSIYAYSRAKPMPESVVLAATKPPPARHAARASADICQIAKGAPVRHFVEA